MLERREITDVLADDVPIERGDAAECLILDGRSDVQFGCEEGQEFANMVGIEFPWMPLAVVDDEAPYPVAIGLLGFDAEVPNATGISNLVEESGFDAQVHYLLNTRAVFPYMSKAPVGQTKFRTAPFYRNRGFDLHFDFGKQLTEEDVNRIRAIGQWINQNFVVRLCALLEVNGIIPTEGKGKIDGNLDGSDEVDLVRRLRNQFAHSSGRYNSNDREERKLYERVVQHFNVTLAQDPDIVTDYPLSIDVVLLPLTKGCKRYIVARNSA